MRYVEQSEILLSVVIPDVHYPHQDDKSLRALENMLEEVQPHTIVQLGDLLDLESLSRFIKHPDARGKLQQEFDKGRDFWARIKKLCPESVLVQLEGNHEARLQKKLWSEAPELATLRDLTIPRQLRLDETGVSWISEDDDFWLNDQIEITHGTVVRGNAGYSAMGEMLKRGNSGVSGHTHRLGMVSKSYKRYSLNWCEAGHLCDARQMKYVKGGVADWQQGFAVVYFHEDWHQITPVAITRNSFTFEGKRY